MFKPGQLISPSGLEQNLLRLDKSGPVWVMEFPTAVLRPGDFVMYLESMEKTFGDEERFVKYIVLHQENIFVPSDWISKKDIAKIWQTANL